MYSIDFYKLNEYWSPDGQGYAVPVYTETETENEFIVRDKAFFSNFNNTPNSTLSLYTNKKFDETEGILSAIDTTLGNGYVTIRATDKTTRSLVLNGATAGGIQTLEMVSVVPSTGITTGSFIIGNMFILNGLKPTVREYTNGFTITGVAATGTSGLTFGDVTLPNGRIRASVGEVTNITYIMDKIADPNGAYDGTFHMYNGITEMMNVTYTGTVSDENHVAFYGSADNHNIYALRYYSDVLTDAERAQNHFADIAKFFKLDVSKFIENREGLSETQANNYYGAFAELTFTSDYNAVLTALEAANALID